MNFTNTDFFGDFGEGRHLGRRNLENLFFALQHPDDPSKFRLLIGENTHILSREDNLSSGNLPTINRSMILEEHGSVNSFGTQFGIEFQKALSNKLTVQLAALDNRGSLNTPDPRYDIGNSLSGKLVFTPINSDGRKLTLGAAIDHTRNIRDRTFTLATAIGAAPLGGVEATGNKFTGEADIAHMFPLAGRPMTIEAEALYSSFPGSDSDVGGGYARRRRGAEHGAGRNQQRWQKPVVHPLQTLWLLRDRDGPVPVNDPHLLVRGKELLQRTMGRAAVGALIIHIFDDRDVIPFGLDPRSDRILEDGLALLLERVHRLHLTRRRRGRSPRTGERQRQGGEGCELKHGLDHRILS